MERLVVSEEAFEWVKTHSNTFKFLDFSGYIFKINRRKCIYGAVNLYGDFKIISDDKGKTKKEKQEKVMYKIVDQLLDNNFLYLYDTDDEPFPEFTPIKPLIDEGEVDFEDRVYDSYFFKPTEELIDNGIEREDKQLDYEL